MSNNLKYYLLYLLLAVIAYWQIAFFHNMLKWDMVDAYLPWRSFISESILNGNFPFWNPYQDFGYPIHADMRSVWVPEVWLISLLGGYSVYTFSVLFIIYTSVAGIGMKLLAGYFLKDDKAAFFAGVTYMLSGYLTAHGQEMSTINSFAFIPVVLFQYLTFKDRLSFKPALNFFVVTLITILSGYQAHSFILFYLLLVLFIYTVIELYKQKLFNKIKVFVLYHAGFVLMMLVLSLPIIISAYQVFPFVQRLNSGVSVDTLSTLSFSPQSLLSMILPFSVVRDIEFFNTDLSMTNLYFGVVTLVMFIVSLFYFKKESFFRLIFIFGVISLVASFGSYTPLRGFLFDYVPFMNLFRGSAFFRLFALIPFVISAGFVFSEFDKYKKIIIHVTEGLLFLLFGFLVFSTLEIEWHNFSFIFSEDSWFSIFSKESTFYENIFLQSLIQIFILLTLLWLILYEKANYKNLLILISMDMILTVQLNISSTSISGFTPKEVQCFLSSQPVGYPVPSELNVSKCTDASASHLPLWRNTNTFAKRVSGDGFNSFYLDKLKIFNDSLTVLRDSVTNNNLIYFSNDIHPLSKIGEYHFNRETIFVADTIAGILHFENQEGNEARISVFSPGKIVINLDIKTDGLLTLIQTFYPGWRAYIDGKEVNIIESNTMFMSVVVHRGDHQLIFEYTNNSVLYSFIFSATLFIILLFFVLYFQYAEIKYSHKRIVVIIIAILVFTFSVSRLYYYHNQQNHFLSAVKHLESTEPDIFVIYDGDITLDVHNKELLDLGNLLNFTKFTELIKNKETLALIWENKKTEDLFHNYLRYVYAKEYIIVALGHSKIVKYSGSRETNRFAFNSFEQVKGNWVFNKGNVVTDTLVSNNMLDCSSNEYPCTYSFVINEGQDISSVFAVVDIIVDTIVNPLLVISVEKNGKNILWKAVNYSLFRDMNRKVCRFAFFTELSKRTGAGCKLKIYIWNKSKENFKIDNFNIYKLPM